MLATSPSGERARPWVQEKLWSDRGRDQAGSSLRQAVSKVNRALGPYSGILRSDRSSISLDMSRVDIVCPPGAEFAEGLDVRDQEFEYWLACERSARGNVQVSDPKPETKSAAQVIPAQPVLRPVLPQRVLLYTTSGNDPTLAWIDTQISGHLTNLIGDVFSVPVFQCDASSCTGEAWCVRIQTMQPSPDRLGVRIELIDNTTQSTLWFGHRLVRLDHELKVNQPAMLQLFHELTDAIGSNMVSLRGETGLPDNPDLLSNLAVRRLFTMRADQVESADRLLARAYDLDPRGTYLAWRAQLREIQFIERLRLDRDELRREAREFSVLAMDREPNNALVLALMANAKLHLDGDIPAGLELAKRSVLLQNVNPMGWWALSAARLYSNDPQKSQMNAQFARFLMERSSLSFWAEGMLSGSLLAMGKIEEAERLTQEISAKNRHFRPALRILLSLYAQRGAWDKARKIADRLTEIEPGFSIDRIVRDRQYPVSMLRNSPKIDLKRVAALG